MPADVADALHNFRQTDHWIAEGMAENLDDNQLGRDTALGRPFNFDAAYHLLYARADLDRNRRAEVFLLFFWTSVRGNNPLAHGVVMQRLGDTWRIACEFRDRGLDGPRRGIRLLARRSYGWRHFRTSEGEFGWRPVRGERGAMDCVFLPDRGAAP